MRALAIGMDLGRGIGMALGGGPDGYTAGVGFGGVGAGGLTSALRKVIADANKPYAKRNEA